MRLIGRCVKSKLSERTKAGDYNERVGSLNLIFQRCCDYKQRLYISMAAYSICSDLIICLVKSLITSDTPGSRQINGPRDWMDFWRLLQHVGICRLRGRQGATC